MKKLQEHRQVDPENYPRYDIETLSRKIRAVTGRAHTGETNLTRRQFERVMEMCRKEYEVRGISIISSRTMDMWEMRCEQQGALITYMRRMKEIAPILSAIKEEGPR